MNEWSVESDSPEATRALGRALGRVAGGGEVLLLSGDLGTGKTCLTQGLASGLGWPEGAAVTSPTFVLHNQYAARLRLDHIDLYRLAGDDGAENAEDAEGGEARDGAVGRKAAAPSGADAPPRPDTPGVAAAPRAVLDGLGWDDWWGAPDGVCAVEWPEVFGDRLPPGGLLVRLAATGTGTRRLTALARDARHAALLDRWRAEIERA